MRVAVETTADFFANPHTEHDAIHQFFLECHRLHWDATFTIRSIPNVEIRAAERLILQLVACRRILVTLDDPLTSESDKADLIRTVDSVLQPLQEFVDRYPSAQTLGNPTAKPPTVNDGSRGRPRYELDLPRALYLHSLGSSWGDISFAMGVVRQTLYNHLSRAGLSTSRVPHTVISDDDLDEIVAEISVQHPFDGARLVDGHLKARDITVAFLRVQESLRRVDPLGVFTRYVEIFWSDQSAGLSWLYSWAGLLRRRVYQVRGSNALWHMDGNEKLRMWGFYVHGCVDGHSRLIVYMQCRSNKTAATVEACFRTAVQEYGWPSRVRGDYGTENNSVEDRMIQHWGEEHNAFLRGLYALSTDTTVYRLMTVIRSMHNVRMERCWRDSRKGVFETFRQIFFHLESVGLLERENPLHRACLHLVYTRRIQAAIDRHREAWNKHRMRTEGNRTPLAIYELSKTQAMREGWWTGDAGDSIKTASQPLYGFDGQAAPTAGVDDEPEYNDEDDVRDETLDAAREVLYGFDFDRDDGNWGMHVYADCVDQLTAQLQ